MQAPYTLLADLPRTLWLPALISHTSAQPEHDTSARRLADVLRWREALLQGQLPEADAHLGDPEATGALREAAGQLNLAALCRQAPALAEQLLRTLLWHLDRLIDLQPRLSRQQALAQVTAEFSSAWETLRGDWEAVLALMQSLGDVTQLRWDEVQGLLSRREWREAQALADQMRHWPQLAAMIQRLGRSERAAPARAQAAAAEPTRNTPPVGQRAIETILPDAPGEWRGIRQTPRIDHMLGSEAALLMHPVGRKLWRARHAEGRLLGYDSQALLVDWRSDPQAPPRQHAAPPEPQALERGPIIICLDTSGSMRGAPEALAKAVVLEAVRSAAQARRGCLLLSFGGPGELQQRDLVQGAQGLNALLDLIGQGFDGGTDIQGPIETAIERVHQARWSAADLLIVSDGEFGCTPATLARLDAARDELGLRVQGVLVGDRETLGLMEVADDIFWVRDWRRFGQGGAAGAAFSPVHSKSLTALYFPNALSARAARHRPGG